jgi:hypothetical protein
MIAKMPQTHPKHQTASVGVRLYNFTNLMGNGVDQTSNQQLMAEHNKFVL